MLVIVTMTVLVLVVVAYEARRRLRIARRHRLANELLDHGAMIFVSMDQYFALTTNDEYVLSEMWDRPRGPSFVRNPQATYSPEVFRRGDKYAKDFLIQISHPEFEEPLEFPPLIGFTKSINRADYKRRTGQVLELE